MKKSIEYNSEKYGLFIISQCDNKKFEIWWDFYDEHEGLSMSDIEEAKKDGWFWEECDVKDFDDLPNNGEFKTPEKAREYIENKFGKVH